MYKQLGLAVEKVFFSTLFYYVGVVYARYLEKWDSFSFNKLIVLAAFNGCLMGFVSNKIGIGTAWMKFPTQIYWLPLVAALSGIWFCLQLAELLKDHIRENELLSYIGRHSWDIMMHHIFFFWLFNTFLYYVKCAGIFNLNTFNYDKYMHDIWFRFTAYRPVPDMLYLFVGIAGPLLCCWLWERYGKEKFHEERARVLGRLHLRGHRAFPDD